MQTLFYFFTVFIVNRCNNKVRLNYQHIFLLTKQGYININVKGDGHMYAAIAIAVIIVAVAFAILVGYLALTLKATQRTLNNVANTLEGVEQQMEGITTETTLL